MNMDWSNGFYRMPRGWMNNGPFGDDPLCRRAAFQWMVEEASYDECVRWVNGKPVPLKRGQFSHSLRFMARAWKWDESRVRRFLDALVSVGIIHRSTACVGDASRHVITICDYEGFRGGECVTDASVVDTQGAASTPHFRDTDTNYKEIKEERKKEEYITAREDAREEGVLPGIEKPVEEPATKPKRKAKPDKASVQDLVSGPIPEGWGSDVNQRRRARDMPDLSEKGLAGFWDDFCVYARGNLSKIKDVKAAFLNNTTLPWRQEGLPSSWLSPPKQDAATRNSAVQEGRPFDPSVYWDGPRSPPNDYVENEQELWQPADSF